MASIWAHLAARPEPRKGNARRHKVLDTLTIALVGSICGAESCVDIADFVRDREALFREFLELPDGIPSHDTFSHLFRLLEPAAFAGCFAAFPDDLGAGVLAIDGKTLRHSFNRAAGRSALHVVTAFAAGARLAVGQVAAGDKASEIVAARTLLGLIDLNGMLVTGDAQHCQGKTARLIRERGRDWLFALKANRPAQYAEVQAFFADPDKQFAMPDHSPINSRPAGLPRRLRYFFQLWHSGLTCPAMESPLPACGTRVTNSVCWSEAADARRRRRANRLAHWSWRRERLRQP